jgi:uncharacterized RmlC-like cupin family protein
MNAPTCRVIRTGGAYEGRQGLTYLAGLTGGTAGSRAICMTVLTLPPGARAKSHLHEGIETAAYVIEGEVEMYYGESLGDHLVARAGEYVYVPAGMPHLVLNRSTAPCLALVAHTASDDQAGIVLLPELDRLV